MMSSPSSRNLEQSNHISAHGNRYQMSLSPNHNVVIRPSASHSDPRRVDQDHRYLCDHVTQQYNNQGSRRGVVENDHIYYSSSQESNVSKRVPGMWSPNSNVTNIHRNQSQTQHNSSEIRLSTQAEIEKLDDLLQELTPRLNDSPSEYLHRRQQSCSNSIKPTTFEGPARQNTFIQGFSPTSPIDGANDSIGDTYKTRVPIVERSGSSTNLDGIRNKSRNSNWHSEEKKKLQRARSLLDEKDRLLTEQLRSYQPRANSRECSMMSPVGYRPGSSQQMLGEMTSYRYSNYSNKDYIPASEWEDVRMFSDQMNASQTRRATSEMDYPHRGLSVDRRNPSPGVGLLIRQRQLIRDISDNEEINYTRIRPNIDTVASYRVFSPNTAGYLNGSETYVEEPSYYTDDIPQVQRRNIRSTLYSSRIMPNNAYHNNQSIGNKIKDHDIESLQTSTIHRKGGPVAPMQTNTGKTSAARLKDMEKEPATPELLKKSINSGFQIRADNNAGSTGISYYDPNDGYLSNDGLPFVSKLSVALSPVDKLVDCTSPQTSGTNRRCHVSSNRTEESYNQSNIEGMSIMRDFNSREMEPDLACLHPNRQSTNNSKPVNAHNSSNSSIRKSAKIWYQPHMSREEAINYLKTKSAGSFIVRQSHTFNNSYGLAVKVSKADDEDKNIRHFLIESNNKGVRIRGCANEPYFGSLTALVHQHTLTKLALPCSIILPNSALESDKTDDQQVTFEIVNKENPPKSSLFAPRTFVALYLGSIDTETLTGIAAIVKAVEVLLENRSQVKQTEVSIRVSPEGVTLTDVLRKLFFRRHYPLASISYCDTENTAFWESPETRARGLSTARIFGFVARKTSANDNMCHLLCECKAQDNARSIIKFISGSLALS